MTTSEEDTNLSGVILRRNHTQFPNCEHKRLLRKPLAVPTLPFTTISLLAPLDYIRDRSGSHSLKMVEAEATLRIAQGLLRTTEVARKQRLSSELTRQQDRLDSKGPFDLQKKNH